MKWLAPTPSGCSSSINEAAFSNCALVRIDSSCSACERERSVDSATGMTTRASASPVRPIFALRRSHRLNAEPM